MSKRRKNKTDWELFYEEMSKPQDFEVAKRENDKSYVRIFAQMLKNPNYKKMSSNAKVAYMYMKQYVYKNEEFRDKRVFEYSAGKLAKLGVMSLNTAAKALKELEHYHFIKKENNATLQCGFTQKWSFDDDWQEREYEDF